MAWPVARDAAVRGGGAPVSGPRVEVHVREEGGKLVFSTQGKRGPRVVRGSSIRLGAGKHALIMDMDMSAHPIVLSEQPVGSIDVPPARRPWITDPARRPWITYPGSQRHYVEGSRIKIELDEATAARLKEDGAVLYAGCGLHAGMGSLEIRFG